MKHLRSSEDAHHSEIIRLEGEVTRGVQERHKLMQKLEEIHVVEDAITDLYLHMKVSVPACACGVGVRAKVSCFVVFRINRIIFIGRADSIIAFCSSSSLVCFCSPGAHIGIGVFV